MFPKTIFLLLLTVCLFTACLDDDDSDDRTPNTCMVPGADQQGDFIQVPNDAGFVLVESVVNNLCPCDVVCVSAGEISVTLGLAGESVTIGLSPGPNFGLARDSLGPWLISIDTVYNDLACPFDFEGEDLCFGITFR